MDPNKKRWILVLGGGGLVACALGTLIYFQKERVAKLREEAEVTRQAIEKDREIIATNSELVKTVIVQREMDDVIKEILSNEKDVLDFTRTLHSFAEDADVTITSLKDTRASQAVRGRKEDFEKVAYTISFEGDAFHLLAFLNKVETHRRFMSVTAFKLQAAPRNDYGEDESPRHKITMDLETYVYKPTGHAEEVKIDNYDRKRDLLVSEISKRAAELRFTPYEYRGPRGRRDPWIDPRVEVREDVPQMSIEEQLELVASLVDRAHAAELLFNEMKSADTIIEEMKARGALEEELASLQTDIDRIQDESVLSYVLAAKRFQNQVVSVVERITQDAANADTGTGPSLAFLRETLNVMEEHVRNNDYERAIEVYQNVEPRLTGADGAERLQIVRGLQELDRLSKTVIEFESIHLDIAGIALSEGMRPVALINGTPVSEGDAVNDELVVRNITPEQIEFAFRGIVLARLVNQEAGS
ncbi:MAG TPA: hypothetical protein ENJ09_12955 [Planctomycetes bacterium]|nr:hypothetical protein [Planctomycetota bacterium]